MTNLTRRTAITAAAAAPILPLAAHAGADDAELLRLGKDLDRAWSQEKAIIDSKAWGDTYKAAYKASSAIVAQIEQEPAHTLEGFQVKARAVMWCHSWETDAPFSLAEQQSTDIRLSQAIIRALAGVLS